MISHSHKTVFVHIPKCGGQSVEQAFLNDLRLTWEDRAALTLGRNTGGGGPPRLAHLSAQDYTAQHFVTPLMWRDYFSFALIRDPVARAVSTFNYLRPTETLESFVQDWLPAQFDLAPAYALRGHGNPGKYHFVRPQVDFIRGSAGEIAVDLLFRLEDIALDWPKAQAATGVKAPLPHRNASVDGATPDDLGPDDIAVITRLYAADYDALPYDLPRPRHPAAPTRARRHNLRHFLSRIAGTTDPK